MRSLRLFPLPTILLACATQPPPTPPLPSADVVLSYGLPAVNPVIYETADTATFTIAAGPGGAVRIDVRSRMITELTFEAVDSGVHAIARITVLDATMDNSASGTTAIGADQIPAPAGLAISAGGAVEFLQKPAYSPLFAQVTGTDNVFRRLFIQVPGGPVQQGVAWTDTLEHTEQNAGLRSTTRSILTSVWESDTTIAGVLLRVISTEGRSVAQIEGVTQGVEVLQALEGTSAAISLWNPSLGLLVARSETMTAAGTMDLPAMGVSGIPVGAVTTSYLRQQVP